MIDGALPQNSRIFLQSTCSNQFLVVQTAKSDGKGVLSLEEQYDYHGSMLEVTEDNGKWSFKSMRNLETVKTDVEMTISLGVIAVTKSIPHAEHGKSTKCQ
jgi:hypothetical protein